MNYGIRLQATALDHISRMDGENKCFTINTKDLSESELINEEITFSNDVVENRINGGPVTTHNRYDELSEDEAKRLYMFLTMAGITRKTETSCFADEWMKSKCIEKGVLLFFPDKGFFVDSRFGDGSNLSEEDIAEGCDDYIYISKFEYVDPECNNETDGAMRPFSTKESDFHDNLDAFVAATLEMLGLESERYIVLKLTNTGF